MDSYLNYRKIHDQIILRACSRDSDTLGYTERHHKIPRCMGGSDDEENLVRLTPEEHFLVHVLLVKIHPEIDGLIIAVSMMCRGMPGKRKGRKLYGWLRRRFSEVISRAQTGSGNSSFGMLWITDGVGSRKIPKFDSIPDGWIPGRKMSSQARENLSKSTAGKPRQKLSEDTKEKIRKSITGYAHSEETRRKLSICNKGRKQSENFVKKMKLPYITDGFRSSRLKEGEPIPEGWRLGRAPGENNSQFGKMWITDGEKSIKIRQEESIPEGWRKGRKMNRVLPSLLV